MCGLRYPNSSQTVARCAAVVISLAFGSVRADEAYHDQADEAVVRMLDESANSCTHELAEAASGAESSSFFVAAEEPRGAPADNAVGEANAGRRPQRNTRVGRSRYGDLAAWGGEDRRTAAHERASATPWMLGPSLDPTVAPVSTGSVDGYIDAALPLAAMSRRNGICENNKALPQDRVFFMYNHFQNALRYLDFDLDDFPDPNAVPVRSAVSVDRFTLGFEKTFLDGLWSVGVRMPFAGSMDYSQELLGATIHGGNVGNLSVILKRLCYHTDSLWISAGAGIEAPIGSDAQQISFVEDELHSVRTINNDAFQVMPFLGFLFSPDGRLFSQGLIEVDIATNGNRVNQVYSRYGSYSYKVNDQTLLRIDLSAGYWLWRDPDACFLSGLAGLAELHYVTALQDTRGWAVTNLANRFDLVDLTVGLHGEITNNTSLRVGGVFPLRSWDNRSFDAEVQAQVVRRF